jgi:hypothetical protein
MNPRTTIIVAIVAALLGVYIYFFERDPVEDETDSEREEVFGVEAEDIQEVEIRRAEGENLKLLKDGESWQIVQPIEGPADGSEVDTLTRNIATLERQRIIAEGETVKLEDFGLAEPEIEVRFRATVSEEDEEEGEEEVAQEEIATAFLIGDETPTGTNRYAKLVGEDKIFVISSYLRSNFDKGAWDLRDKKILHFETGEVEKLVLRRPEGELVLAKASDELWNVAAPGFCRADRYKASSLASRFETARMEEIVSESANELKQYGLSRPTYEVEIQLRGGKSTRLLVGEEKDNRYYAHNPDRPLVFLIGSSLVDDIKKDASEYRSKRLFEYATYQVDKFQIAAADQPTRIFEKKKKDEDEEEKWVETAPQTRELDRTKVEDLLYKMNGTDAEGFATTDSPQGLEPYGLETPAFTITVWSKDGESVEELTVGKPEGEWVHARRKGDEPILKLKSSAWEEIESLMAFEEEEEEAEDKESNP